MVHVRKSTVIQAPVEAVWAVVRDFNAHDQWHPAIQDSTLENDRPTDAVGAVRSFHLTGGEHLRERLLSLSDREFTLSYCLIETPIPLHNYVAHIRLIPITDGSQTYWEWASTFEPPPGQEAELVTLVGDGVYGAGFEAVRALLQGRDSKKPISKLADDLLGHSRQVRDPKVDYNHQEKTLGALPKGSAQASQRASATHSRDMQSEAIVLVKYGGPEQLVATSITVSPPAPGEVRIRHAAIGINYIDVYCRTGQFDLIDLPGVPGLEAAGVVLDVGAGVESVQTGDRVAYACVPPGAYCEVRNIAAKQLVRLPDDISDETAAGGLVKGLTAHFLLHEVHRLRAGETVLVHAAAGGVGMLLTQWAHTLGARVIGTVSSESKALIARDNGCDEVINYAEYDFADVALQLTDGAGANLVVDGVGRQTFPGSLKALANRGHLISYGQASGPIGQWNIDELAAKSVTLSRPNFGHYTESQAQLSQGANKLFDMLRRHLLRVRIDRRFKLADAADAHHWLQSRQSIGSNLLII